MNILNKARSHLDEASYLYGFSDSLAERINVTWFLLKKKRAQLSMRIDPHAHSQEDALIPLYGARHVVDLLGSEVYLLDEIYRERLYDRLASFVPKPGDTVVDVGANVGIFAVRQALRGARVYAFEPNPQCYRRLSKAVVENALTERIGIFNYAMGRSTGFGTMHVPQNQTALGAVVPVDISTSQDSSVIKITSLDQILPPLGVAQINLLKIDTEGAEVDVLCGAERTLRTTDRIILEYHSPDLRHQVSDVCSSHSFRQVLHVATPAPFLPEAGVIYAEKSVSDGENH